MYRRLANNCHWSHEIARRLFDFEYQYTFDEVQDALLREYAGSGESESDGEAVEWSELCAKAIFDDVDVSSLEKA